MATTLTDTLFSTRYRDDYADSNHYHRILFNSGVVLQARELTQMQTIIQKEIERFGKNVFKEGAAVLGGGITVDTRYEFVKLDTTVNTLPVVPSSLVGAIITGSISGVQAKVLEVVPSVGGDPDTLYIQYTSTSAATSSATGIRFTAGENLTNSVKLLTSQTVNTVADPAVGAGTRASTQKGFFFTQGHFVQADAQTIIISKYTNNPTLSVGFKVAQSVYTADDDNNLYDNQTANLNLTSPGADRYRIDMTLAVSSDVDSDEIFVYYANIQEGIVKEVVSADESYNKIADFNATRVREINGDFIKKPFTITYEDHPTDNTKFNLIVSPGLAYINGYRKEKIGTTKIEVNKATATETVTNDIISIGIGNYVFADTVLGVPNIDTFETYNLRSSVSYGGSTIGTARVKSVEEDGANYRFYLFDIQMNSGQDFRDVRSIGTSLTSYANLILENNNATLKDTINNDLLFPFKHDRVSAMTNISYTILQRDLKTTDGLGAASLNTLSGGEAYTDTNDWIFAKTSDGVIFTPVITITNGGLDAAISGAPAGQQVEIIYKKQISASVRTKTLTNTTVTTTVTTPASGAPYINLGKADIIDTARVTLVDSDGQDVSGRFILDNGQRDNFYDVGRLVLKGNQTSPSGNVFVRFNYYSHGAAGDLFAPNSYPAPYGDIPKYTLTNGTEVELNSTLDFRSRIDDTGSNFTGATARYNPLPTNTSLVTADVTYFLPRYDKLILTNPLKYLEGNASFDPQFPLTPANSLELYKIRMNPGSISTDDMITRQMEAKGFTMKDIAGLENRLDTLEEVTALSLLEVDLKNFSVLDSAGVDRTKAGFLVDNFRDHLSSDTNNIEYRASINPQQNILRPLFNEEDTRLLYDSSQSTNVVLKGDNLYIKYDHLSYINQPLASGTENVNPFAVITNRGHVTLSPASDNWKETKVAAIKIISGGTRLDTNSSRLFGNWGWNWGGVTVGQNIGAASTSVSTRGRTTTTTTSVNRVVSEQTIREVIGDRVLDVALIPFMRSRKVFFKVQGLRPNTRHFAFFGGTDVNDWVDGTASFARVATQTEDFGSKFNRATVHPDTSTAADRILTSDAAGSIEGSFFIPNTNSNRFRTGKTFFELMDVTGGDPTAALSRARGIFTSKGVLETVERSIRSTREISIATISSSSSVTTPEPDRGGGGGEGGGDQGDPLAQSFFVDKPAGVFISKVKTYFKTKDATIPVQLQIRPMIAGVPDSIPVPGGVKFVAPADVQISNDASLATEFEFDEPIFLQPFTEYAIVLLAESVDYNAYIAETEQFELNSTSRKIVRQPSLGSLFLSQNGSTWNPVQSKDMKFELMQAKFKTTSATAILENVDIPKRLLENNPFSVDNASQTVSVFHQNHGFIVGDNVVISGLDSSLNYGGGITGSVINGTQIITAVDENNYQFNMSSTASAGITFGGLTALASENHHYEVIVPSIATLIPTSTDILCDVKLTSGKSQAGNEVQYNVDNNYTRLTINEDNYLEEPKVMANREREIAEMASAKSANIRLTLTTGDSDLSPIVDMQRASMWLIHNMIDYQDSAGSSGVLVDLNRNNPINYADESDPNGGSHFSKHIVKTVVLEQKAVGVKILLSANRPSQADFDVYYKVGAEADNFDAISWSLIAAEENLVSDENPFTYRDYTYLVGSTGGLSTPFDKFTIKIVMKSRSSAKIPTFKDLRVIAMAV